MSDAAAGELANYRDYLGEYRKMFGRKCEDLSPEQLATRSVPPSTLSLLGLVRHMAYVEQAWFQRALQGNLDEPRPFTDPSDRDFDFNAAVGTAECVEDAFTEWRRQIALADEWLDTQDDESMGADVVYNSDGETCPVRDILVHMVEEYARHCGHADLLRECIDGVTGE
ncbi:MULTISPECIES: DinB family protein [unclassified Nocardioides]|uniref:DinB family protein n=1 Tax=unclassified Nocardioides TaxID=2615069 RepID=UPI000AEC2B60|nr:MULTISPECIES: DinB family protein [unclassified Nocardioides]